MEPPSSDCINVLCANNADAWLDSVLLRPLAGHNWIDAAHNANSHICAPVCVNHVTALSPAVRSVTSDKNQVAELCTSALKDKRRLSLSRMSVPYPGFTPKIQAYDSSSDDTDATPHYKAIMKQLAAEKEEEQVVLCKRICLTCTRK